MRFLEYLCRRKKTIKLNGSKNLLNGGKFADEFFISIVKKFSFRKNCPNRPKTACFCPNGSKMVVKVFLFKIFRLQKKVRRLPHGSRRDTLFALLQFHISAEHSVDFLCRLFEITFVHAVMSLVPSGQVRQRIAGRKFAVRARITCPKILPCLRQK